MALSSVTTAPLSDESLAFGELSLNITSGSQSHVINAVYTQKPTELGPEWNFINVLSAAQALLVDFLPINPPLTSLEKVELPNFERHSSHCK